MTIDPHNANGILEKAKQIKEELDTIFDEGMKLFSQTCDIDLLINDPAMKAMAEKIQTDINELTTFISFYYVIRAGAPLGTPQDEQEAEAQGFKDLDVDSPEVC